MIKIGQTNAAYNIAEVRYTMVVQISNGKSWYFCQGQFTTSDAINFFNEDRDIGN